MASLACDLDQEAIGESKSRSLVKLIECGCHHLVILNGQILVVEKDLDCSGDLRRSAIVNSVKHP